jgi:tRNA A37 methylthiotransferase MiaB
VAAERARRLREAAAAKNLRFREGMLDRVEDVLVLEARDGATGDLVGLTGNYMEVTFPGPDRLRRRMARVHVTAVEAAASRGRLEEA